MHGVGPLGAERWGFLFVEENRVTFMEQVAEHLTLFSGFADEGE